MLMQTVETIILIFIVSVFVIGKFNSFMLIIVQQTKGILKLKCVISKPQAIRIAKNLVYTGMIKYLNIGKLHTCALNGPSSPFCGNPLDAPFRSKPFLLRFLFLQ